VVVTPRPDPETVAALLDTSWRVAQSERERTDSLAKGASLATFAAVVLSLTATLSRDLLGHPHGSFDLELFASSLASLVAAVGFAVAVLLPREQPTFGMSYLERLPMWSELMKERVQVQGETIRGLVAGVAQERAISRRKARFLRAGFAFLFVGLLLVAAESTLLLVKGVAR
jgi:hypothetical protein